MNQDFVNQNICMTLGDLVLQTIMLKARVAELEAAAADAAEPMPPPKTAKREDRVNGQG